MRLVGLIPGKDRAAAVSLARQIRGFRLAGADRIRAMGIVDTGRHHSTVCPTCGDSDVINVGVYRRYIPDRRDVEERLAWVDFERTVAAIPSASIAKRRPGNSAT